MRNRIRFYCELAGGRCPVFYGAVNSGYQRFIGFFEPMLAAMLGLYLFQVRGLR